MYLFHRTLFVLFLLCHSQAELKILSDTDYYYSVNNAGLKKDRMLQVQCTQGETNSFFLTTTTGQHEISVTCPQFNYTYYATEVGVIPRAGQLVINEYCVLRNPTGTELTYIRENEDQALKIPFQAQLRSNRRLLFNPVVAAVGGGIAGGMLACTFGMCGGGGDPPDLTPMMNAIDGMKAAQSQLKTTMRAWLSSQDAWRQNNVENFRMVHDRVDSVETMLQDQKDVLQNLVDADDTQNQMINHLSTSISSATNELKTDIITTNQQLVSLAGDVEALLNASSEADLKLYGYVNETRTLVNIHLEALTERILATESKLDEKIRRSVRMIRDLTGAVRNMNAKIDQRRGLTHLVRNSFLSLPSELSPFLNDTGTSPADDAAYRSVLIDRVRIHTYGEDYFLYEDEFSFVCKATYMMRLSRGWNTWRDFMESMGPENCNTDLQQDNACNCWVEYRTSSCTSSNPSFLYNPDTSNDIKDLSQQYQTACDTAVSYSPQPKAIYTSGLKFTELLMGVPATGTKGLCFKRMPRSYGSQRLHKISSFMLGMSHVAPYNSTLCEGDIVDAIEEVVAPNYNWIFGLFRYVEISYTVAWTIADSIQTDVDGTLSNDVHFEDFPLIYRNGRDGSCIQAHYMAYPPAAEDVTEQEWLSVERLQVASVEGVASVRINGTEVQYSSLTPSTELSFVLEAEYVLVGKPFAVGAWSTSTNQVLYDVDRNDVSLSPAASARAGKVTYALAPNREDATHASWTARNGVPFVPKDATNMADFYAVNTVNGKCSTEGRSATQGSLCSLLDSYEAIRTVTSGLQSVKFRPLVGTDNTATFQMRVPDGEIVFRYYSACPSVIQLLDDSTNGYTLSMTNGNADVPITVCVLRIGGCQDQAQISLKVNETHTRFLKACTSASTFLSIFPLPDSGSCETPPTAAEAFCGGIRNTDITISREDVLNTRGVADLRYVQEFSLNTTDRVALSLAYVANDVVSLLTDLMVPIISTALNSPLPPVMADVQLYQSVYDRLKNTTNTTQRTIQDLRDRTNYNFTGDIQDYQDKLKNLTDTSNQALKDIQANLTAMAAKASEYRTSVDFLEKLANDTRDLGEQFENAMNNFAANSTNVANATLQGLQAVFQASSEARMGFGGIALGAIGDLLADGIDGVQDLGEDAINGLDKLTDRILDKIPSFDLGNIGNALAMVGVIIGGCAFLCVLGFAVKVYRDSQNGGGYINIHMDNPQMQ